MPKGAANPPDPRGGSARRAEFELLYEQHSREVWALAYARWMDSDLAMDITQEAYLRLWKQWEAHEEIQNPRAWLLRVARNLAEDYAKSAFRRNGTQPPELLNGVRSSQPQPVEALERQEQFAQLRAVLDELGSERDRQILLRFYVAGDSKEDICADFGLSSLHFNRVLFRARERYRVLYRSIVATAEE